MDDQLYNIIKYLDNEMSNKERIDFESRIQKDKALAKEVEFQRGVHGYLKREQPGLEQKLSDLGDEFIINQSVKKRLSPYWFVLLILLLVISMSYFYFNKKNNTPPNDIQEHQQVEKAKEGIRKINKDSISPPKKDATNPVEIPPKPKKTTPKEQPIALLDEKAFEKSPLMEEVIAEIFRNDDKTGILTVTTPKENAILEYSPRILFELKGSSNIQEKLRLIIYPNRDFDIENDYRILNAPLNSRYENDNQQFYFKGELSLEKGLYYLVIQKNEAREVLYISRFIVE